MACCLILPMLPFYAERYGASPQVVGLLVASYALCQLVAGPILGSFLITPLSELLRSSLGSAAAGLHLVIYGVGLIVVMLYFPSGLVGALAKLKPRLKRRRPLP